MEWVEPFFSQGGRWWGPAEWGIEPEHVTRARDVERLGGPRPRTVLELGAGYGATSAALADRGHRVTAIELSPVRAAYARRHAESRPTMTVVEGDFYAVDVGSGFDVLGYWNGFGVGTDADQRRLLRRIALDWLRPGGRALVTAFNPWYWAREAGRSRQMPARPADGYDYDLTQERDYDPVGCRFVERWWPTDAPERAIAQTFRCYTPVDLLLLLEGTGLVMVQVEIDGQPLDPNQAHTIGSPLWDPEAHEYLAVLEHAT